jgi:hypothetical protein
MRAFKNQLFFLLTLVMIFGIIILATTLIWNWLMPWIFKLPRLSLVQVSLLYVLVNLIRFDWLKNYNDVLSKSQQTNDKK